MALAQQSTNYQRTPAKKGAGASKPAGPSKLTQAAGNTANHRASFAGKTVQMKIAERPYPKHLFASREEYDKAMDSQASRLASGELQPEQQVE